MLIDTKESQFLSEDSNDIVGFSHEKLSPLLRLPIVRKDDLKTVFDMKYSIEANGSIIHRERDGIDYLKHFFTIDNKKLTLENCAKHDEIKGFFDKNGIVVRIIY